MNEALKSGFENAGNALNRLGEALEQSAAATAGSILIDGTIQRFEFTLDTFWKLLRKILHQEKVNENMTPKQVMITAYSYGLLEEEKTWLAMLDDRNLTSHTYRQELAAQIYERIKIYYPLIRTSFDKLKNKYE